MCVCVYKREIASKVRETSLRETTKMHSIKYRSTICNVFFLVGMSASRKSEMW